MRPARLLAVARKEAIQIARDPWSLGMAFAIPMLLIVLYGSALTLDVDDLATVVHDQDRSPASRAFVERLAASGYFRIVATTDRPAEVTRALESGAAQVAVVLPRDFARDLARGRPAAVQALVDGSDANTATLALAYLEGVTARAGLALRGERTAPAPAVEARLRVWYNPELQSRNYIIPGLIAVIMMVIAALLTSLSVAREWDRGTMEQLVATPVRVPELVLGKLLPYFAIGLLDVALCVLAGVLIFRVPLRGSPLHLLAAAVVFLLGALGLGLLISIRLRTQVLASQVALTATFLPAFLLSGFVFDVNNLPPWLRAITYLVPARYFITIVKGIFLKGVGPAALAAEGVFLVAFAALVTGLALRAFRKRLD
jgi:ABC-2 type transport system permease protein